MNKFSKAIQNVASLSIAITCLVLATETYEGSVLQKKMKRLTSKFHKKS